MAEAKFTRGDIYDIAETIFEIVSSLSRNECYWDSIGENRRSASDDIVDLAIALDSLARDKGIQWGETHDYIDAMDALFVAYLDYSEKHGCVKKGDDIELARNAINDSRIARDGDNGELIDPALI